MQCIFIVNNNIQKKKGRERKRKGKFHRENKRFGGQAKQTKHKHKPNQTLPKDKI